MGRTHADTKLCISDEKPLVLAYAAIEHLHPAHVSRLESFGRLGPEREAQPTWGRTADADRTSVHTAQVVMRA